MAIGRADARKRTQSGNEGGDTILVVNGVDRKDKVKGTVGEGQGAVVPGGDLHCHPQIRRALGRHRHHVVVDLHAVEIEAAVGEGHEVVQVEATQVQDLLTRHDLLAEREVDRKSVGVGKSVSVRVDLGGSRIIKKKKTN